MNSPHAHTLAFSASAAFLLDGCGVTEFQYTIMAMSNMLAAWATNFVYKRVFFKWKFQTVYFLCVLVAVAAKINDYIAAHSSLGREQWPCFFYFGMHAKPKPLLAPMLMLHMHSHTYTRNNKAWTASLPTGLLTRPLLLIRS